MRIKSEQRMRDICNFIDEYQFEYHRTPTMEQIADAVGTVQSNVFKYLNEMEKNGMISRSGKEIYSKSTVRSSAEVNRAPVLGCVTCGEPTYAEENFEEYIPLPVVLFGKGDFFILRTTGLSMIEAGIEPGDMVVVKKQNTANEGDIVVALTEDNGTTLKRYYTDEEKHCVRLHPENKTIKDIYTRNCRIQGIAQHVIKAL